MPKVSPEYLEARKNEILDAAFACFRRRGFHQTTMQDIYRETGLSPGAVYHYFRSKEEIIAAAIDRNTAEWAKLIAAVRSLEPSPNQALEAWGATSSAASRCRASSRKRAWTWSPGRRC
jgi:AcrR family transcriptional regulator